MPGGVDGETGKAAFRMTTGIVKRDTLISNSGQLIMLTRAILLTESGILIS